MKFKKTSVAVTALMTVSMFAPAATANAQTLSTGNHTGNLTHKKKKEEEGETSFLPVVHVQRVEAPKGNVKVLVNYSFKNKSIKELKDIKIKGLYANPTSTNGNKVKIDTTYAKVRDGLISVNFNLGKSRVKEFNPNMVLEYSIAGKDYHTDLSMPTVKTNVEPEHIQQSPSFAVENNIGQSPVILTAKVNQASSSVKPSYFNNYINYNLKFSFKSKDGGVYNIQNFQVLSNANIVYNKDVEGSISKEAQQKALGYYNSMLYSSPEELNGNITSSSLGEVPISTTFSSYGTDQSINTSIAVKYTINGKNYTQELPVQKYKLDQTFSNSLELNVNNNISNSSNSNINFNGNTSSSPLKASLFLNNGSSPCLGLQYSLNNIESADLKVSSSNNKLQASIPGLTGKNGVYHLNREELQKLYSGDYQLEYNNITTNTQDAKVSVTISNVKTNDTLLNKYNTISGSSTILNVDSNISDGDFSLAQSINLDGQNFNATNTPKYGETSQITCGIANLLGGTSDLTLYSAAVINNGNFIMTDNKENYINKDLIYMHVNPGVLSSISSTKEFLNNYFVKGDKSGATIVKSGSNLQPNLVVKKYNVKSNQYTINNQNSGLSGFNGSYNVSYYTTASNGEYTGLSTYTVGVVDTPSKFNSKALIANWGNVASSNDSYTEDDGNLSSFILAPTVNYQSLSSSYTDADGGYNSSYTAYYSSVNRGNNNEVNTACIQASESPDINDTSQTITYQEYLNGVSSTLNGTIGSFGNMNDYSYAFNFNDKDINPNKTYITNGSNRIYLNQMQNVKGTSIYYIPYSKMVNFTGQNSYTLVTAFRPVEDCYSQVNNTTILAGMVKNDYVSSYNSSFSSLNNQSYNGEVNTQINGKPFNLSSAPFYRKVNNEVTLNFNTQQLATAGQQVIKFNPHTNLGTMYSYIKNQTGIPEKYTTIDALPCGGKDNIPGSVGDISSKDLSFKLNNIQSNSGEIYLIPKSKEPIFEGYLNGSDTNFSNLQSLVKSSNLEVYKPGMDLSNTIGIVCETGYIIPGNDFNYTYTGNFSGVNKNSIGYSGFNYYADNVGMNSTSNINKYKFLDLLKPTIENVNIKVLDTDTDKYLSANMGFSNKDGAIVSSQFTNNFNYEVKDLSNDYSTPNVNIPSGYYQEGVPEFNKTTEDGVTNISLVYKVTKINPYSTKIRFVNTEGIPLTKEELKSMSTDKFNFSSLVGTFKTRDIKSKLSTITNFIHSTVYDNDGGELFGDYVYRELFVNGNNAGNSNSTWQFANNIEYTPKAGPSGSPDSLNYNTLYNYNGNNTIDVVVGKVPTIKYRAIVRTLDGKIIPGFKLYNNTGSNSVYMGTTSDNTDYNNMPINANSVSSLVGVCSNDTTNVHQGNYPNMLDDLNYMNEYNLNNLLPNIFSLASNQATTPQDVTYEGKKYYIHPTSLETISNDTYGSYTAKYDSKTNTVYLTINAIASTYPDDYQITTNITVIVPSNSPLIPSNGGPGVNMSNGFGQYYNNIVEQNLNVPKSAIENSQLYESTPLYVPGTDRINEKLVQIPGFKLVHVLNSRINIPDLAYPEYNRYNLFKDNSLVKKDAILADAYESSFSMNYVYAQIGQYVKVNVHNVDTNEDINGVNAQLLGSDNSIIGTTNSGSSKEYENVYSTPDSQINLSNYWTYGTINKITQAKIGQLPSNLKQVGKEIVTTKDINGIPHTTITINVGKGKQVESNLIQKVLGSTPTNFNAKYLVTYINGTTQELSLKGFNQLQELDPYEIKSVTPILPKGFEIISNNLNIVNDSKTNKLISNDTVVIGNIGEQIQGTMTYEGKCISGGKYFISNTNNNYSPILKTGNSPVNLVTGTNPNTDAPNCLELGQYKGFKVMELPEGYIQAGPTTVNTSYETINGKAIKLIKLNTPLIKKVPSSITTEIKCGNTTIGSPKVINGDYDAPLNNYTPVIPEGYTLSNITVDGKVISAKDLPTVFPKTPETIVWNVQPIVKVKVRYQVKNSSGNLIPGFDIVTGTSSTGNDIIAKSTSGNGYTDLPLNTNNINWLQSIAGDMTYNGKGLITADNLGNMSNLAEALGTATPYNLNDSIADKAFGVGSNNLSNNKTPNAEYNGSKVYLEFTNRLYNEGVSSYTTSSHYDKDTHTLYLDFNSLATNNEIKNRETFTINTFIIGSKDSEYNKKGMTTLQAAVTGTPYSEFQYNLYGKEFGISKGSQQIYSLSSPFTVANDFNLYKPYDISLPGYKLVSQYNTTGELPGFTVPKTLNPITGAKTFGEVYSKVAGNTNNVINLTNYFAQIGQYVNVNVHNLSTNSDVNNIPCTLKDKAGKEVSTLDSGSVKSYENVYSIPKGGWLHGYGFTQGVINMVTGASASKLPANTSQVGEPIITTKMVDGIPHTSILINIKQDKTVVNTKFETADGTVVKGGQFTVNGKVTDGSVTLDNFENPTVKVTKVPEHFKTIGDEIVTSSIKNGIKTEDVIQRVAPIPQSTITVEYVGPQSNHLLPAPVIGTPVTVTGYEGSPVKVTLPKVPKNYYCPTTEHYIPKTFGNKDEVIQIPVQQDITQVVAEYIEGSESNVIHGGSFILNGKEVNTYYGDAVTDVNDFVNISVKNGKLPFGYEVAGKPILTTTYSGNGKWMRYYQPVKRIPNTVDYEAVDQNGNIVKGVSATVNEGKSILDKDLTHSEGNYQIGTNDVTSVVTNKDSLPTGYVEDGNITLTKTVTKAGNVSWEAVQHLTKLAKTKVTIEYVGPQTNHLLPPPIIGTPVTVSGYEGSKVDIQVPKTPEGYYCGQTHFDIPITFGDKDVIIQIPVVRDMTQMVAEYVDGSDSNIVKGGSFTINGKEYSNSLGDVANDYTGFVNVDVQNSKLPVGYELNGKPQITTSYSGQGKWMRYYQPVKKISTSITTEIVCNGKVIGTPNVYTGVYGSNANYKELSAPKGYHITSITVNGKPVNGEFPTHFGLTNDTIIFNVAPDTHTYQVVCTSNLQGVSYGVSTNQWSGTWGSDMDNGYTTPAIPLNGATLEGVGTTAPTGYKIVGQPIKTEVTTGTYNKVTTITYTYKFAPIPKITVTNVVETPDGKVIASAGDSVSGYPNQLVRLAEPVIPNEYHLVSEPNNEPILFPYSNVKCIWVIAKDMTYANTRFVTADGTIVPGGSFNINGKVQSEATINGFVKPTIEVNKLPEGYKAVGPLQVKESGNKDLDPVYTGIQVVSKLPTYTVKTEVRLNGHLYNNEEKSYSGYEGYKASIATPVIPEGYHLLGTAPKIPTTFTGNKTLVWNIAKNITLVDAYYSTSKDGEAVVGSGSITVNGDNLSNVVKPKELSFTGLINPKVDFTKAPTGYKIVGKPIVIETTTNGVREIKEVQLVSKLPTHSITVEYTDNGTVIGRPMEVSGYEGSAVKDLLPALPKEYHIIGNTPTLPTSIGSTNDVIKIPVAKTDTIVNVDYITSNGDIISNGLISVEGKNITTTDKAFNETIDGNINPSVKFIKAPAGYESVESPIDTFKLDKDGNKVYTIQQVVTKLPDHSITVQYVNKDNKVIGTPSTVKGYQGQTVKVNVGEVPEGYTLSGKEPTIPTIIGNKNEVINIPVIMDTTQITAKYVNSSNNDVVSGGTFNIDNKIVGSTSGIVSTTINGFVNPSIKDGSIPAGYELSGAPSIKVSTVNGTKTIEYIQQVKLIPSNTINTQIVCNNEILSKGELTYKGTECEGSIVKEPKLPKGYTIVKSPTIPSEVIGSKTFTWEAVKDNTIVNVTFVDGNKDISGGSVSFDSNGQSTTIDSSNSVVTKSLGDSLVTGIRTTKTPEGYSLDGKVEVTSSNVNGVTTINIVQKLSKLPTVVVNTNVLYNGKVIETGSSYKGYKGTSVNIETPRIPEGYHIVKIPEVSNTLSKNETISWVVMPNETLVNTKYVDSTGATVQGGSWNIDGKDVSSVTLNGFVNPTVKEISLPSGWMLSGKAITNTTYNNDGNKVVSISQEVTKIPEGKITTSIECNGVTIGNIDSYTGYENTIAHYGIPSIPAGYTLKDITLNGKEVTSLPKDYTASTQNIVWNVVKENPTFSNEIISNVPGATYQVTYVDGSNQTITNSSTNVKLENKEVKSIKLISNPTGYNTVGKEGVESKTVEGLNTNTQWVFNYNKIPTSYSNTLVTNDINGTSLSGVVYKVTYSDGTSKEFTEGIGSSSIGDSSQVVNISIVSTPSNIVLVNSNSNSGTDNHNLWTKSVFNFAQTSYVNHLSQSVEGSSVQPTVVYRVNYKDGKSVDITNNESSITLNPQAITSISIVSISKGYKLVKAINPIVTDSNYVTTSTFGFKYEKVETPNKVVPTKPVIVKPVNPDSNKNTDHTINIKPVVKNTESTITVKMVDSNNKEIGTPISVTGKVGSKNNLELPSAPVGYKIVSITDNGVTTSGMPSTFTKDKQEVVVHVEKVKPVVIHHDSNTVPTNKPIDHTVNTNTSKPVHKDVTPSTHKDVTPVVHNDVNHTTTKDVNNITPQPVVVHHVNIEHQVSGNKVKGITKVSNPVNTNTNNNNTTSKEVNTSTNPKTGDSSSLPFAVTGIGALLAFVGLNIKRKRKPQDTK